MFIRANNVIEDFRSRFGKFEDCLERSLPYSSIAPVRKLSRRDHFVGEGQRRLDGQEEVRAEVEQRRPELELLEVGLDLLEALVTIVRSRLAL